jgi:hypothetical protein
LSSTWRHSSKRKVFSINQAGLEAPFKQMPHLGVPPAKRVGVDAWVQTPLIWPISCEHELGKIGLPVVDHKVVVIAHQAVGEHLSTKQPQRMPRNAKQACSIHAIHKDRFAPITSGYDVMDGSREFDSEGSSHRLGPSMLQAKSKT